MMPPRLRMLKPSLANVDSRVRVLPPVRANATPRRRGRAWMRTRLAWLAQHPLCEACSREGRVHVAEHVDHRVPLADGGADDWSNYSSLCVGHHQAKSAEEAKRRGGGG